MKLLTFSIGLAWLIYGALFFDYPDWDIGVSLVMAASTYLFAEAFWNNLMKLKLTVLDIVGCWWCVDGAYAVYWSIVDSSVMIRTGQWLMSLCLFLLCGACWSILPRFLYSSGLVAPKTQE